ncbi:MAG TPA: 23S rRNA (guanosine(2251)-2'-O)-methyltransferase RlmB [SAR86 cluster bacterium]|jgi:23S rRNA (guanosine2251-2'-O)-methyltransferase|nr:23S rRNA (guanosine(2251)-2'-O)-methyltransferase RlmB [SAR86 cluster bacterium]HJM15432.1 23S rRNA (guanosine(2251)-2'-O)-methyltransferase RlmB [SAR86 cluster bacterium]
MNLTKDQEMVCGINAVNEIISIRPSSVTTLFIKDDKGKRMQELDQLAKQNKIEVVLQDSSFFQKNFSEMNHQNVAIICHKRLEENENFLENLFEKDNLLLLILEHITDPHNVGACIRTAAAAGVDAVIVPKNRSCHLTSTVRKISSGGAELIPFVVVTNIVRTINKLQSAGVMIYGSDMKASKLHNEITYGNKSALIIGSEEKGLKRLTLEKCDEIIRIKMPGRIESLNASVSAGIMLFQMINQQ